MIRTIALYILRRNMLGSTTRQKAFAIRKQWARVISYCRQLAKMIIDPKLVEFTSDVVKIFL